MADRRITIEAELDASGVVRGSTQLVDQFGRVIAGLRQQGAVVQQETSKQTLAFERFANAPSRGISVLDALNATVLQATNGFQNLGVASTAASVGLRAAIFSASSFLTTNTILVGGLAALAAVLALVGSKSDELTERVRGNVQILKEFAATAGPLAGVSASLLAKGQEAVQEEIKKTEAEIARYQLAIERAKPLQAGFAADFKRWEQAIEAAQLKLVFLNNELQKFKNVAAVPDAIPDVDIWEDWAKAADEAATAAERLALARQGQEHMAGLELQELSVRQQMVGLALQQADSEREINDLKLQKLFLLEQERLKQIELAIGDQERLNINLAAELERQRIEKEAADASERLNRRSLEQARQLEAQYRAVAATVADAFVRGFHDIEGAFRSLMERIAQEFIESQIVKLLGSLSGGGGGSKLGNIFGGAATGFGFGGIPGAIVGGFIGGFLKPGGESPPPQLSAMPAAGGEVTINIQALDRRSMERAVRDELMPIVMKMLAGRQVAL